MWPGLIYNSLALRLQPKLLEGQQFVVFVFLFSFKFLL